MTIILFLVILAVLVLVHEAGHFFVAKLFKIRVDEFGIGFPPRLFSWEKGETRYSVNLIPFGGFVKIFGEDPTEEIKDGDAVHNFSRKPRVVQAVVLVAGVVGNFLLAWALLSFGFAVGLPAPEGNTQFGVPVTGARLTVVEVLPDSPAAHAGLAAGDIIKGLAYGDRLLKIPSAEEASTLIAQASAGPVEMIVERGEKQFYLSITPSSAILEGRPAIGIAMDMVGRIRIPWYRAPVEGLRTAGALTAEVVRSLGGFIRDVFAGSADFKNLAGPVGIASLIGEARAEGLSHLLLLTALISLNLAVINLIPFPALDGGRLLFVALEAVRRKPIPPKVARGANVIGFIFLFIFLALVTAQDIARFWGA